MLLVSFAVPGNGEESEGGSQSSENPMWQIVAPHNQLRSSCIQGRQTSPGVMRWRRQSRDTRAILQEPGCPGTAWFKPALTNSTGLWAQWLWLLPAWTEGLCQAVLEVDRAVLVLCELNRVLESSWLYGEFTLPGLNCETACSCAVVGIIVLLLLIWVSWFLVTAV